MVRCRYKRGSAAPTANPHEMSKLTQEQVEFTIFRHNLQPHPIGSFYQTDHRPVFRFSGIISGETKERLSEGCLSRLKGFLSKLIALGHIEAGGK